MGKGQAHLAEQPKVAHAQGEREKQYYDYRACYNCGEKDHLARNCPLPLHDRRTGGPWRETKTTLWSESQGEEPRGEGSQSSERRRDRPTEQSTGHRQCARGREENGTGVKERRETEEQGKGGSRREAALEREVQRLRTILADEGRTPRGRQEYLSEAHREQGASEVNLGAAGEKRGEWSDEEDYRTARADFLEEEDSEEESDWGDEAEIYMLEDVSSAETYLGDKGELGLRGWRANEQVMPPTRPAKTRGRVGQYPTCSMEMDWDPPARDAVERQEEEATVVRLNNQEVLVRVEGIAPRRVIVDTVANHMVMRRGFT